MVRVKISAKEANKLARELGIDIDDEETTYYATNEERTEIWGFETKTRRDRFVDRNNKAGE